MPFGNMHRQKRAKNLVLLMLLLVLVGLFYALTILKMHI